MRKLTVGGRKGSDMAKLLYIQASPRGPRSKSMAVADAFVQVCKQKHRCDAVEVLNVFEAELCAFDGPVVQAKYNILHGREHTKEELSAWQAVEQTIEEFGSADKYVFAVPMWNFGIPYRFKQYIDVIVQPGYTFSYSPEEGYKGLMTGRSAFIAYARGGEYSTEPFSQMNYQSRYLEAVLGFIGISEISSVVVEPTLMGGEEVADEKLVQAIAKAKELARNF